MRGMRSAFLFGILLLVRPAFSETLGDNIYAIGPGKLPHSRTILSMTQVTQDVDVCSCIGGWAQNWGDKKNEFLKTFPAIGVYDEGPEMPKGTGPTSHIRICPTMQVGKNADGVATDDLAATNFTLAPQLPSIAAGEWVAVEVDIQGTGILHAGGELWNKAVVAPIGQCPKPQR